MLPPIASSSLSAPDGTAALEVVDAEGRRRGQITGAEGRSRRQSVVHSPALHSNGFELYRLADGDWQRFARANLVESVCAAAGA
ncbi:MAG: hypothetical protein ABI624_21480 [Casimicrobiaceae bacterium]